MSFQHTCMERYLYQLLSLQSPSDGISGLGFPLLAELNTSGIPFFSEQLSPFFPPLSSLAFWHTSPTCVDTLIAQKQVTSPVFSFKLSTNDSELCLSFLYALWSWATPHWPLNATDLGGINHALYNGSISYTPVLQELYWTVALDNVTS